MHGDKMARDPVCGMTISKDSAAATEKYKDHTFYFCSEACREQFDKNRDKYATPAAMMM
ncbi:YHS domain-containing protein [Methanocella sp. MCL-LM]|uniref:YHS domain-containing protein n=1 Tax=Methanocella sp. MCL-LM TaxID=3412035 RepID=UPI003C714428